MTGSRRRTGPAFKGLKPASPRASAAARGASHKTGTRCEVLLRRALRARGLRFTVNSSALPGSPDIVFRDARLVVFCDGDFWHGRRLKRRIEKLAEGHNAPYWMAKIQRNVARDRKHTRTLRAAGWRVVRLWESEILLRADALATKLERLVSMRR